MKNSVPSLSGTCVLCVPRGGKWNGEWQISKNFGTCGASGKFFSKFRETLTNPNASLPRGQLNVNVNTNPQCEFGVTRTDATVQ